MLPPQNMTRFGFSNYGRLCWTADNVLFYYVKFNLSDGTCAKVVTGHTRARWVWEPSSTSRVVTRQECSGRSRKGRGSSPGTLLCVDTRGSR